MSQSFIQNLRNQLSFLSESVREEIIRKELNDQEILQAQENLSQIENSPCIIVKQKPECKKTERKVSEKVLKRQSEKEKKQTDRLVF
jgi:hypothetical protein